MDEDHRDLAGLIRPEHVQGRLEARTLEVGVKQPGPFQRGEVSASHLHGQRRRPVAGEIDFLVADGDRRPLKRIDQFDGRRVSPPLATRPARRRVSRRPSPRCASRRGKNWSWGSFEPDRVGKPMRDQRHTQAARDDKRDPCPRPRSRRDAQVADPPGIEIPGRAANRESLRTPASLASSGCRPAWTRLVWASRISRATARL